MQVVVPSDSSLGEAKTVLWSGTVKMLSVNFFMKILGIKSLPPG